MGLFVVILVDTTVVIDLLRGSEAARAWLEARAEVLAASEITRVEVLTGMRSPERHETRRALDAYHWFPVTADVSSRAGALGRQYRASHQLDIGDLVVAATASVHALALATANVKHFPMIEGLRPPY